ncbi:MAG TPA: hypothetical protein VGQ41_10725 [Pyrinomonadaceae bacterium]|jgi:hypothetical protein|nr:hypothetical protein [Pyrinomonadaceae bacterium]
MPYTQDQINEGQKRINYELNEVDKKLIEALRSLVGILSDQRTPPASTPGSRQMDFSTVEAALSEASTSSDEVADIDPPGCLGPGPGPYPPT